MTKRALTASMQEPALEIEVEYVELCPPNLAAIYGFYLEGGSRFRALEDGKRCLDIVAR